MHDAKFLCYFLNPGLIPKENDLAFRDKMDPAHNSVSLYDANMTDKWFGDGEDGEHDSSAISCVQLKKAVFIITCSPQKTSRKRV